MEAVRGYTVEGAVTVDTPLAVILPHYDCDRYLGTAVASVLEQDFRDLTLIVVDDNSPGTGWREALRAFAADPRLVVYQSPRNVGPMRLDNAVLSTVRSRYVGFQDADDVSAPGRFRRQVSMLDAGRADIVGCHIEHIDEAGIPVGWRRMPRNGNLFMRLGRSTVMLHGSTVARREVFDRLGGYDASTRFGADTDFLLRASYLFRLRNVRHYLYRYRIWSGSLTQAPETGFGSQARDAYTREAAARERARRRARSRAELLPLLRVPTADVPVALRRVDLAP